MQITSGRFDADMFAMASGTDFETESTFERPVTLHLTAVADDSNTKVTIFNASTSPYKTIKTGTVSIRGLESSGSAATGKFHVNATGSEGAYTACDIQFVASDVAVNDVVEVSFYYTVSAEVAEIDNKSSAVGEAVLVYPVYGSADNCQEGGNAASIIGHVILTVFRARITQQPGLDGSYKSASTYAFTLATLDPKRDDDMVYSIAYIKD